MYEWIKFIHLGAGIVWLGGMALVILAMERIDLMRLRMSRKFAIVVR